MPVAAFRADFARDMRARRVTDYASSYQSHRTENNGTSEASECAIGQALSGVRDNRREDNTRTEDKACDRFLHNPLPRIVPRGRCSDLYNIFCDSNFVRASEL
jgi:hypothetical protein